MDRLIAGPPEARSLTLALLTSGQSINTREIGNLNVPAVKRILRTVLRCTTRTSRQLSD